MFFLEIAESYQKLFQDPATPMMNGIIDLHHYIFMYLMAILIFVLFMLFTIVIHFIFIFDITSLEQDAGRNRYKVFFFMLKNKFYQLYKESLFYIMTNSKNEFFNISRRKKKAKFFSTVKGDLNDKIYLFKKKLSFNFFREVGTKIFWNNFWSYMDVATLAFNNYTKRFRLMDDVMLTPPSFDFIVANWSIPTITKENYGVGLVESTIDNTKSDTNLQPFVNLRGEGAFVTSLFLKIYSHNQSYPLSIVLESKQIYGGRFEPKAYRESPDFFMEYILCYTGYEVSCIFNPYLINLLYWVQIYSSIRSGLYKFTHNTLIEIIWTIIPSLILVLIGIPSFILLYAMDEIIEPDFIVKCIGHQWYWSYEIEYLINIKEINKLDLVSLDELLNVIYNELYYKLNNFDENNNKDNDYVVFMLDLLLEINLIDQEFNQIFLDNYETDLSFSKELKKEFLYYIYTNFLFKNIDLKEEDIFLNFSSYMLNENDLKEGELRLLEVDNPLYLPVRTHIDLLITANDVLHSWTVPSFGIKCDAVPGRLNHSNLFIERTGVFYGQCSEICGVNHGFMPIKVIVEDHLNFSTRFISNI